jgi:hypothetical protein
MNQDILFFMAWALLQASAAALAWSMPQHHERLGHSPPGKPLRHLAIASTLLLSVAALHPCIEGWGITIGITLWLGLTSLAILLAALTLSALSSAAKPR